MDLKSPQWLKKVIGLKFSIVDRKTKDAEPKKIIDIENSLGYPLSLQKSCRGRGTGVLIFLLKSFFFIPDLAHRSTAAPKAAENRH